MSDRYYPKATQPDHPRATSSGQVGRHILVAEAALGRALTPPHEVHHVNGDKKDFSSGNLVLCEDHPYHVLLHLRQAALDACGHADWRKCWYCKRYDDVAHLSVSIPRRRSRGSGIAYHKRCAADYESRRQSLREPQ